MSKEAVGLRPHSVGPSGRVTDRVRNVHACENRELAAGKEGEERHTECVRLSVCDTHAESVRLYFAGAACRAVKPKRIHHLRLFLLFKLMRIWGAERFDVHAGEAQEAQVSAAPPQL
jgi:hypothetical protein